MKLTVKSLTKRQMSMLKDTNKAETSLTVQYMNFLVDLIDTHGVADLIGRERLSISKDSTQTIYKAKVSLGNCTQDYNAVRSMVSNVWTFFVKPCLSESECGEFYNLHEPDLKQAHKDVKSGKRSISKERTKAKKASGNGGNGGNGGGQSIEDRVNELFKYVDKLGSEAKRKAVLKQMAKEIAKRS